MNNNIERRNFDIGVPKEPSEDSFIVCGYAATFDTAYCPYIGIDFKEIIARDAFSSADMKDVVFLCEHEGNVLARTLNDSLVLWTNEVGLAIKADLGATEAGRELYRSVKARLVTQMSLAFTRNASEYDKHSDAETITSIKKVYEVSAVWLPANPETIIQARRKQAGAGLSDKQKAALKLALI
ncbi:hypothetical protein FACS1894188_03790 [Clostridia bacterium]|nr:hypothetical protein FACS1894188_03790 [Clostridia bacterium]